MMDYITWMGCFFIACVIIQWIDWFIKKHKEQRQKPLHWDQVIVYNDGKSIRDKFGKPTSPPPPDKKIKWLPDYVIEQKEEEILYDENDLVKPINV